MGSVLTVLGITVGIAPVICAVAIRKAGQARVVGIYCLPTVGDSDDVFYDQRRKRIYASGGEGAIAVYQQQDSNHYGKIAQIETVKGARTSLFVPELNRIFLAVRRQGDNAAAIRVYEATD